MTAALLALLLVPVAGGDLPAVHPRWQRTLEDALLLAQSEQRPLLLAVNMDGESACERIVVERYRDPGFAALVDRFVPLLSSAFRHEPRDHDDRGRRIECGRLPGVTCGEHIELEPLLFERFLGGERIAPRHALVERDGTKRFDLFLLFDLGVLDRALADAARGLPPAPEPDRTLRDPLPPGALERARVFASWARRVEARERAIVEERLARLPASWLDDFVGVLAAEGRGRPDGMLWILTARAKERPPAFLEALLSCARRLGRTDVLRSAALALLAGDGHRLRDPTIGPRRNLIGLLGKLDDPDGRATRTLIGFAALGGAEDACADLARAALRALAPAADLGALEAVLESDTKPVPMRTVLALERREVPPRAPFQPDRRDAERARTDLDAALALLDRDEGSRRAWLDVGLASLRLGELAAEGRTEGDPGLLWLDAEHALDRAGALSSDDPLVLLARARVAWRRGDGATQERAARAALAVAERGSPEALDAWRWLADAKVREALDAKVRPSLRLAASREAAQALVRVLTSGADTASDWLSLTSLAAGLGRPRLRTALARLAADRFPRDPSVRNELMGALAALGRPDLVEETARDIRRSRPGCAFSLWYEGYGARYHADSLRRGLHVGEALAAYARADRAFAAALAMEPAWESSVARQRALAALGRGFCHSILGDREGAADALVEAVRLDPSARRVRDALDREPIDLLDAALEWRRCGESPVDPLDLLRRLAAADPEGAAFWARWVCDSELREALRADGRGERALALRYLDRSIEAGRRAVESDPEDPEARRALAQSLTIRAEWALRLGPPDESARRDLAEAARLLGLEAPGVPDEQAWRDLARRLRTELGEARPAYRPGR